MKPKSSNINKGTCKPVSANCTDWPEVDLNAIKVCDGDSVTDIIVKLDHVLAAVLKELDFSDEDLKCLIPACANCPDPVKTLKSVIMLIISKVCKLEDVIKQLGGGTAGAEAIIRLASCFQYTDIDGDKVLELPLSQYVKAIGTAFCGLKDTVTGAVKDIEALDDRLTDVEDKLNQNGDELEVQLQCTFASNDKKPIVEAVEAFEQKFCQFRTVVGDPSKLTQAISKQCAEGMGSGSIIKSLSSPGDALPGWKYEPATIADAVTNIWIALCDMRGAVKAIQDNCCAITCDDITIDFDIKLSDDRQTLTLFFAAKSILPNGFADVNPLGNKLIITDSDGNSHILYVKIADAVSDVDGIEFNLSASALNPKLDYNFDMDATVTNGSMTCSKCIHKVATFKAALCDYCEITAVGSGDASGSVVIIYEELNSNS
jgi:hypothetical protein